MHVKHLSLILLSIIFLASCSGTKKATEKATENPNSASSLAQRLVSHDHDFEYYSGSGSAEINDPELELTVGFNFRLKRDSLIWFSGSKFGFEAIRAIIRPDSVFVISRLDQTYYVGAVADLPLPFDFEMIQDFITARSFYDGKTALNLETEETSFLLKNGKENEDERHFSLDKRALILNSILIPNYSYDDEAYSLKLDYSNYTTIYNQYYVPLQRELVAETATGIKRALNLQVEKISIDKQLSFPFRVNPKYTLETL